MHKISRRNFLMTCGKTAGGLAAMTAFGGCASPEQAENGLFGSPSALPVKTDDRLAGIDAIVQDYMNQGYFPGAVIAVVRGGKIVYQKAYGYAMLNDMGVRLDDPRPMEQDTLFDMASCTKIMATTQSIMKLYSEGRLPPAGGGAAGPHRSHLSHHTGHRPDHGAQPHPGRLQRPGPAAQRLRRTGGQDPGRPPLQQPRFLFR